MFVINGLKKWKGTRRDGKLGPKAPPASAPHQVRTDVHHKDCPDTSDTKAWVNDYSDYNDSIRMG